MGSGNSSSAPEAAVPEQPPAEKKVSRPSRSGLKRRVELGLEQGPEDEPTLIAIAPPPPAPVESLPARREGVAVGRLPELTTSTQDLEDPEVANVVRQSSMLDGRAPVTLFKGNSVGSWRRGALLGKGAGGVVYEAIDETTNTSFCVKMIEFDENFFESSAGRRRYENLKDEVLLMKTLRHRNIIRFLGLERRQLTMYILMELVPGGSLSDLIKKVGPLPDTTAAKFSAQLLNALVFIGKQGVVHRDIKGANILVSVDGALKLGDFGASKNLNATAEPLKTMAGTPYWMAPEVVRQEGSTLAADIWSLGCTVIEMVTGAPPFCRLPPMQAMFKIGEGKDEPLDHMAQPLPSTPALRDFLQRCLQPNPEDRPTAESLLTHPWIKRVVPHVEEQAKPSRLPPLQKFIESRSGDVEWSLTDKPVQGGLQELARPAEKTNHSYLYMSSQGVDSRVASQSFSSFRTRSPSIRQGSDHSSAATPMASSSPSTRPSVGRNRTFKAVLEARGEKAD